MKASRLAGIPVDHVVAEIAAAPFSSVTGFQMGILELDPLLRGTMGDFWRAAEAETLDGFPAFSVDEIVLIRDRLWFNTRRAGETRALSAYLQGVASAFLQVRESVAVPDGRNGTGRRSSQSSFEAEARWAFRWLSFALPKDFLLAGLPQSDRGRPTTIDPISVRLAKRLSVHGFGEMHLHLGAALDFPSLWVALFRALADPTLRSDQFKSPGAAHSEGRNLGPWLLRAAIARYILAAYLSWGRGTSLDKFVTAEVLPKVRRAVALSMVGDLTCALGEVTHGSFVRSRPKWASLQFLYRQLTGLGMRPAPENLDERLSDDPIAEFFPYSHSEGESPHSQYLAGALAYLESAAPDRLFEKLFWQTERIRCQFYRHVVQRPMTPGLQWFVRFYARISPGRRSLSKSVLLQSAARVSGVGAGLRSLEVRTSTEDGISSTMDLVRAVSELRVRLGRREGRAIGHSETSPCEVGLVLHFTRDRGGGAKEGRNTANWLLSHADPCRRQGRCTNPSGYRYAHFYGLRRKDALAFAGTLRDFPLSLGVLRGFDVCTDELGVPCWVLSPLLRHVRQASVSASAVLHARMGVVVPPLQTTVHAGEDFVHLLGGLRRISDALQHWGLSKGDRIGHGVALGVDPEDWASRAGRIAMTREDRLLDLAWEWSFSRRMQLPVSRARLRFVKAEIARLSEAVFGRPVSPVNLEKLATICTARACSALWAFRAGEWALSPAAAYEPNSSGIT